MDFEKQNNAENLRLLLTPFTPIFQQNYHCNCVLFHSVLRDEVESVHGRRGRQAARATLSASIRREDSVLPNIAKHSGLSQLAAGGLSVKNVV